MKRGKEQYSYLMSKHQIPDEFTSTVRYTRHWATSFRRKHKEEFNESYATYLQTGKVVLKGKEMKLIGGEHELSTN